MKKYLIPAIAVAFILPITGVMAQQAIYELKLEASSDIADTDDDAHAALVGGLGWYHSESMLIGGYFSFEKKNYESYWGVSNVWGLGAYGEYLFNLNSPVVPYLGASLGFLDGSNKDDDTTFVMAGSGGIKVFLTETMAVSAQLNLNWADNEIYDYERTSIDEGDGNSFDVTANIGLRLLY